jgi:hypothetical protein
MMFKAAAPGPISRLATLAALATLISCAPPTPIEGAPCPCPSGYFCDVAQNACVAGGAPGPSPGKPPAEQPSNPVANPDPSPSSSPPAVSAPTTCPDVGARRPDQLTSLEYRFAVADLLGVTLTAAEMPPDLKDQMTQFIAPSGNPDVEMAMRDLAKVVAMRARPTLKRPTDCPASLSDDACGRLFVDSFGQRAFRRPLNDADRTALTYAFTGGQSGGGLLGGLAAVIETALASDNFLRRHDVASDPQAKGVVKVDAWTIGSRLAALLWRSNPDEPLLAAARTGQLLQPSEIEGQVTRMLQDPRAERMLTAFFRDWLEVDEASLTPALTPPVPGFTSALRASALRSFDGFAGLVYHQDASLTTLLTTPETLADRTLATFYGLVAPAGTGFEPVAARDQQIRRGLLTSPGFLIAHSSSGETKPVDRGRGVSEKFLCVDLPPPPPNVTVPPVPDTKPGTTTRQRYIQHDENPACSSCHHLMDPLGFGLENYDGLARWRTTEMGATIDPSGMFVALSDQADPNFEGPVEMIDALASAPQVQQCYARQWFRFGFGRKETDADACTIKALGGALTASSGRTKSLLLAIAQSEAFKSLRVP